MFYYLHNICKVLLALLATNLADNIQGTHDHLVQMPDIEQTGLDIYVCK